jgi:carbonic anhydrase
MNHGSKQFMAWTLALGLSGTIYGGGAWWLKHKKATGHSSHSDDSHGDSHDEGHHDEHAAAGHGDSHDASHHDDHAVTKHDSGHGDEHKTEHKKSEHKEEHPVAKHDSSHGDDHKSDHKSEHKEEHAAAKHDSGHGNEHSEAKHTAAAHAPDHKPHWTYGKNDASGPAHWGDLSANFSVCEKGMEQSPIDVKNATYSVVAPKLTWHYQTAGLAIENNGHTIQSNIKSGDNFITIDGEKYTLAQFHFHNPSEHRFAGTPSELELHFVHKNAQGKLAVVGVMINEAAGKENVAFKPIWDHLPRELNSKAAKEVDFKLTSVLPAKKDYVHYKGSLTTPPCSEGVRWFVLKEPVTMSSGQVEMYSSIFDGITNRPVQPLQGRDVITNTAPAMAH